MAESPSGPRATLVGIALELLEEVAPEELSIREVARRAGVTSGAPYHHFRDKTELLAACVAVAWRDLGDRLGAPAAPGSEAVADKSGVYVGYALAHPGVYRLMVSRRWDADPRFHEVRELRNLAMRRVVETIVACAGLEPRAAKERAMVVWALLHGHVGLVLEGALAPEAVPGLTAQACGFASALARLPSPG